jgi:hypothetical protein
LPPSFPSFLPSYHSDDWNRDYISAETLHSLVDTLIGRLNAAICTIVYAYRCVDTLFTLKVLYCFLVLFFCFCFR